MIWLYRLLFLPLLLIASPYYVRRMLRRGGYRKSFQHRFGLLPTLPEPKAGCTRIWIQAVSVGEVKAVAPLVRELHQSGRFEIVLTTTTSTGYALARDTLGKHTLATAVFPLDFWLFSRRAWRRIQPQVAVLMESELWPEHLHQARVRGCPVVLLNARMSDRSFRRYRKFPRLARRLLRHPRKILASSKGDCERLVELGANAATTIVAGNLKFESPQAEPLTQEEREKRLRELGLWVDAEAQPLILLGSSTWPGEEAFLLHVLDGARRRDLDVRLLIVPRHAERRGEIRELLEKRDCAFILRSETRQPERPVPICVADTTGELAMLSQLADVAFIGKSLPPNEGGQTPIEAAGLGLPIVYGPNMSNFREVVRSLEENSAALCAQDTAMAEHLLLDLLENPAMRKTYGEHARAWHQENRGALAAALRALEALQE